MYENINESKTIADLASANGLPVTAHQGIPYVVVPKDYALKSLEPLMTNPARKKGDVTVTTTASFIAYFKSHMVFNHSSIYAEVDSERSKFSLIAVLNDHCIGAADPGWRDHRCIFEPQQTVEWKRWDVKNKIHFSQAEFASWLEDNLGDVATVPGMPTGADILQMATGFEANTDRKLRSKINLQNGAVQFEFTDEEAKETRTKMQVFERFTLGLPVFEGSKSAYPLEVRLKYREKDGKVIFWYELIRPDRVFKTAVDDELKVIFEATAIQPIFGKP